MKYQNDNDKQLINNKYGNWLFYSSSSTLSLECLNETLVSLQMGIR